VLNEKIKQEIRIAFENVRTGIAGFKTRGSQNKMIAEISKTLAGVYEKKSICVEAPTGTGKTIAYLVSSIPIAKSLDKKLIISSANVALQEQLLYKDIPDIKKYSQLDFSYTLVKGRSRYVCIRDLSNAVDYDPQQSMLDLPILWDKPPAQSQIKQLQQMNRQYCNQEWDGDKDSLKNQPDNLLWSKVSANRHTCSARRCNFYNDCCFFKSRKKVNEADVIIANHDLVLADLSTGNTILPNIENSIFILDEAHHLATKALSHFSESIWLNNIENILNNILKLAQEIDVIIDKSIELSKLKQLNNDLLTFQRDFIHFVQQLDFDEESFQFKNGVISAELQTIVDSWLNTTKQVYTIFSDVQQWFKNYSDKNTVDNLKQETINANNAFLDAQLLNLLETLISFAKIDNPNKPPKCRWIEKKETKTEVDFQINVSNINIAEQLTNILWKDCYASVLTSATLTALGSFERLKQQAGLDEKTQYLRLPSPFNYNQINFNIANINYEPNHPKFTESITKELKKRIDENEGTLVLFSANQQMQIVASEIENKLNAQLFIQGEFSKQVILEKHISLRKKGKGSVIFGLDSFAEGVDLPGDLLTHLIIVKLRFSVPNSPIEKATYEYLESQNKNPFNEVSLPDASLKLIQACGRLIRTETDAGKITIFDKRLVSKFYGKKLLNALPPFNIIVE